VGGGERGPTSANGFQETGDALLELLARLDLAGLDPLERPIPTPNQIWQSSSVRPWKARRGSARRGGSQRASIAQSLKLRLEPRERARRVRRRRISAQHIMLALHFPGRRPVGEPARDELARADQQRDEADDFKDPPEHR
jgi:hypothetical protein